jgi:hypothetical protein
MGKRRKKGAGRPVSSSLGRVLETSETGETWRARYLGKGQAMDEWTKDGFTIRTDCRFEKVGPGGVRLSVERGAD